MQYQLGMESEVHHAQSQDDPLVFVRALADIVAQHLKEKDGSPMRLQASTFNVQPPCKWDYIVLAARMRHVHSKTLSLHEAATHR